MTDDDLRFLAELAREHRNLAERALATVGDVISGQDVQSFRDIIERCDRALAALAEIERGEAS